MGALLKWQSSEGQNEIGTQLLFSPSLLSRVLTSGSHRLGHITSLQLNLTFLTGCMALSEKNINIVSCMPLISDFFMQYMRQNNKPYRWLEIRLVLVSGVSE